MTAMMMIMRRLFFLFVACITPPVAALCYSSSSSSSCNNYVIRPGVWEFRGHPIAYEKAEQVVDVVESSSTSSSISNRVDDDDDDDGAANSNNQNNDDDIAVGDNNDDDDNSEPVLLLNGFGVGSFHQHRLIHELLRGDGGGCSADSDVNQNEQQHHYPRRRRRRRTLYCLDYLGQGKSWPIDCQEGHATSEQGLRYCGETWLAQIIDFIEQVILPQHSNNNSNSNRNQNQTTTMTATTKVHIVGNSVGGHLAVFCAVQAPHLVKSLALLNPTPVWGLNLPGWTGHLPAPWLPKRVGRVLFDRIRDMSTIEQYLKAAYANRHAFDETLMTSIRDCTTGSGGHAAFSSILWSPPLTVTPPMSSSSSSSLLSSHQKQPTTTQPQVSNFYDALGYLYSESTNEENINTNSVNNIIPVFLLFGRDDPWCKPILARRMLERYPTARYVEFSNVGHCPNHEAPVATARALTSWWAESSGDQGRRGHGAAANRDDDDHAADNALGVPIQEAWGTTVMRQGRDIISASWWDRLVATMM